MLFASILAHVSLGIFLAFFFVLYYINGDGKWKIIFEAIIGLGGNLGIIFVLDKVIDIQDKIIKTYSFASCFLAFIAAASILLIIVSIVIRDRDGGNIIRLRDILLGQYSFINGYYNKRMQEIDNRLSIPNLEARESKIKNQEAQLESEKKYIADELERIEKLGEKKQKLILPENKKITLSREYIAEMPSYVENMFSCISNINSCTESFLTRTAGSIDISAMKSYLISVATFISGDLFGGSRTDARVHFRIYDEDSDAYIQFVAIMGGTLITQNMTAIPYSDDSMIKKSFECKRALIKSINTAHDYKSNNHKVWQDYMTYTFYGLTHNGKPFLSFGISVKNADRYKRHFYFINYFRFESFLQSNIDLINNAAKIESIFYEEEN